LGLIGVARWRSG